MHVNLLPQPFRRRLALRRQAGRWAVFIVVALAIGSGFVAKRYHSVCAAHHAQAGTAARSKDLHALKAKTARMLDEANNVEASIALLRESQPEDRTLALLGIAATSAKTLDGKVHLKCLTTQLAPVVGAKQGAPPARGAAGKTTAVVSAKEQSLSDFVLEGTAEDAAAIATFIEVLRGATVFTKVDLTATNEAGSATGAARQFRLDCKF
jgi:hypothetical protein